MHAKIPKILFFADMRWLVIVIRLSTLCSLQRLLSIKWNKVMVMYDEELWA
jgi:hypothetical protein